MPSDSRLSMRDPETYPLRELEFERFVAELLSAHPRYSDVRTDPRIGRALRPDLTAIRQRDRSTQRLVIEVKAAPFMRPPSIEATIRRIDAYRNAGSFDAAVLVFPGRLRDRDQAAFEDARIEVWDLDYVATTFAGEIQRQPSSPLTQLFSQAESAPSRTETEDLIRRLRDCPPGKPHWSVFQRIVKDAFECLFVPPLERVIGESADASGANRRDVILPNHAPDGFWKSMRETYKADYIVVEAKNYKRPITKTQALQVANYLKPHGAGMFAIIAARNGANGSCMETIREQRTTYEKMMVPLTGDDIENMLRTKGADGSPEEFLVTVIRDFRLSM